MEIFSPSSQPSRRLGQFGGLRKSLERHRSHGVPAPVSEVSSEVLDVVAPEDSTPEGLGNLLYGYVLKVAERDRLFVEGLLAQYDADRESLLHVRTMLSNTLARDSKGKTRSHDFRTKWLEDDVLRVALGKLSTEQEKGSVPGELHFLPPNEDDKPISLT